MVSQKSEDKKRRIINAAKRVFAEHGYYRASVDKIADVAGIAKGTVYLYFSSKADLFCGFVEYELSEVERRIKDAIERESDPFKKIEKGILSFAEYMDENRELFLTLMYEPPSLKIPEMKERFLKRVEKIHRIIEEVVKEGVKKGVFKRVRIDVVASAIMGMVRAVVFKNIFLKPSESLKKLVKPLMEMVKDGILKKEGK